MTSHRIVVLDPIAQEGLDMLAAAKSAGIEYEVRTGLKSEPLKTFMLSRRVKLGHVNIDLFYHCF